MQTETVFLVTVSALHDFGRVAGKAVFANQTVAYRWGDWMAAAMQAADEAYDDWDGYRYAVDVQPVDFVGVA